MQRTILIIDDEEKLCLLVGTFLGKKGYSVISAKNGKLGIRAARYRVPDLILLDINMPKMDGLEVLKRLKSEPKTMSIPVIMLTGHGDEYTKLKAANLYSENYITKPFDLEDLYRKINQLFEIMSGSANAQDASSQVSQGKG